MAENTSNFNAKIKKHPLFITTEVAFKFIPSKYPIIFELFSKTLLL